MADSKGTETANPAVMSRREAIVGALALAAGTLIAAKPEAAIAMDGQSIVIGGENSAASQTLLMRTPSGELSYPNAETMAYFNFYAGSHHAIGGWLGSSASAGSSGVYGRAVDPTQFGITAQNVANGGIALNVQGGIALSRSGKTTVTKRHSTRTVTLGSGIDPAALILVTLQSSPGSGVYLKYARRTSATTFKVYLNKAATSTVTFGWMIVG